MNFVSRPYHLFIVAGVLSLVALRFTDTSTVDIHLHDTYYIISPLFLLSGMAVVLVLLWGFYKLADRYLRSKFLTWAHVIITVFAVAVFLVSVFNINSNFYLDFSSWTRFNQFIVSALVVGVIAQLLFVINIIGGIFKLRFH